MTDETPSPEPKIVRWGVVAVIVRDGRLLIIKRSQHVLAPGMYCFPGGGIEPGETHEQALIRELDEELGCKIRPLRRLWENVSSWGVHLTWWTAELDECAAIVPNPLEVESVHWFSLDELRTVPNQLESNDRFVTALASGDIRLD
jgi:8-oxo-dGTP pyrophosphatase MutT (NUDIX family)